MSNDTVASQQSGNPVVIKDDNYSFDVPTLMVGDTCRGVFSVGQFDSEGNFTVLDLQVGEDFDIQF